MLSSEQIDAFQRDGYLVISDFFTEAEAQELLDRTRALLDDFSMEEHPLTSFSPSATSTDYFLTSGDKIRYFFESDAVDSTGRLARPKASAVNKIGHALHHDPVFHAFTFSEKIKQITKDLQRHRDPRVVQSMVICKQPKIGGEVPIHDDSTFLWTDPPTALGFWFALEPVSLQPEDNGCLSFVPGSHKRNRVSTRMVRLPEGGTGFRDVPGSVPCGIDWTKEEWSVEECGVGSLVLIDGLVIHASRQNHSNRSRLIYTFHIIEGDMPYPDDNWLQIEQPFARLYH